VEAEEGLKTRLNKRRLLDNKRNRNFLNAFVGVSEYRILAFLASVACCLAFVNAAVPQVQMYLLGGQILFGTGLIKAALLVVMVSGFLLHPRVKVAAIPLSTWLLCIGFLIVEIGYLIFACGISLGDVLLSYNDYYFLLLIGPALLVFRGAVSERVLIRCSILVFVVCAALAAAQHLTSSPILYTESADGSFSVSSWNFIGEVRAFSLFGSALEFGLLCAFSGALGIALTRTMPIRGALLFLASGLACYTTLTRLCYLVFFGACACSLVLTFGKKPSRGRWQPFLNFLLGIATILIGINSVTSADENTLQDAGSLLGRIDQWSFFSDLYLHSTLAHKMFGLGLVQDKSLLSLYGIVIDNILLALILHIGVVGLVLFGVLLIKMWIYLRREAVATQQPFVIAATSLWATFACTGIFNLLFGSFGAIFALAILCERKSGHRTGSKPARVVGSTGKPVLGSDDWQRATGS
jgi:hypothetical protein